MSITRRSLHTCTAHLRRFDEDEEGAILLACLAGCLIVFMVSLTMYDVGNVTREKIKLQTATDSAAYSQASIKARTMNANAYVNVTKRSIVGIHLTYFTAQNYLYTDMWKRHNELCVADRTAPYCQLVYTQTTCNSPSAYSATSGTCPAGNRCCNLAIAIQEQLFDVRLQNPSASTPQNSGGDTQQPGPLDVCTVSPNPSDPNAPVVCQPVPVDSSNPIKGLYYASSFNEAASIEKAKLHGAMDKYTKELRQLTRYQEYMQVITPWWAFSEALARATHNGATMATAYPAPANLDTSSLTSAYPTGPTPTGTMDDDWSWPASNLLSGASNAGLAAQFGTFRGHICSEFTGGSSSSAPFRDPLLNAEVQMHVDTLKRNSDGSVQTGNYAEQVFAGDNFTTNLKTIGGYSMCFMLALGRFTSRMELNGAGQYAKDTSGSWNNKNTEQAGFGVVPLFDPNYSSPYLLSVDPHTSELARMRLSNVVFGYSEGSDFKRQEGGSGNGMTRFEYMTQDYTNAMPDDAKGTGLWTMARGEIVTLGDSDGNWHASWTARVRPIARPGELNAVENEMGIPANSFMSNAFRTATPYLGVNASIGHVGADPDDIHPEVWDDETKTMDRAMKNMDSASSPGIFK